MDPNQQPNAPQQPQEPVQPQEPTPPAPPTNPMAPPAMPSSEPVQQSAQPQPAVGGESDKEYLAAWLLSYFLGVFGADRFYLGYTGLGIAKLLTLGGCGIWALIDWVLIFAGVTKDKEGRPLAGRQEHFKTTVIIFIAVAALSLIGNLLGFFAGLAGGNS